MSVHTIGLGGVGVLTEPTEEDQSILDQVSGWGSNPKGLLTPGVEIGIGTLR